MTGALDTPPELALDDALYQPLPGAEPMGPRPEDWEVSLLEIAFPDPTARVDASDRTPRNYHDRREMALKLLQKTRDLSIFVRLAEAHGHLEGPKGLHAGLHLALSVTRAFWAEIHPGPPENNRARNGRLRAYAPFCERKLVTVFDPFVVIKAAGFDDEITLRHFYIATERHAANKGRRSKQEGESTYTVGSLQELVAKAEAWHSVGTALTALNGSVTMLRELQGFLNDMPEYQRLKFSGAVEELGHYAAALEPFASDPGSDTAATPAPVSADGAETPGVRSEPPQPTSGMLKSLGEAQALLDEVIGYYAAEERSSPIPLVLLKIRGMIGATFTDWLAAVAAGGSEDAALAIDGIDPKQLDAFLPTKIGIGAPPEAHPSIAALDNALAALSANEAVVAGAADEIKMLVAAVAEARVAISAGLGARARPANAIRDRVAVREALQRLAHYYRAAEPSSPISVCFERIIHLVDRAFIDIVRELAPEGKQAALRLVPKDATK